MKTFIKFVEACVYVTVTQIPLRIIDWIIVQLEHNTPYLSGMEYEFNSEKMIIKPLGLRAQIDNPSVRLKNSITIPWLLFCKRWWKFRNSQYGCNLGEYVHYE